MGEGVRRRLLAVVVAVVAVLAGVVIAFVTADGGGEAAQPTTTTTTIPTTTTTKPVAMFYGALAVGDEVQLYEQPDPATGFLALSNPTFEHVPLWFQVVEQRRDGWLQVKYNKRPNGARAWIRAEQVQLSEAPNRIEISLSQRHLWVYLGDSDQLLYESDVAIGKESSPTPVGDFYVDARVRITNVNGPYGAFQLSVAGFSDVYQTFGGGIGQIAIHGTNQPNLIGADVSNGCIRMTNEQILALEPLAPYGTPVIITA